MTEEPFGRRDPVRGVARRRAAAVGAVGARLGGRRLIAVVAAVGVVLVGGVALLVGANVGRSIVPSSEPERPDFVRWADSLTDVSLSVPSSWQQLGSRDPEVRLVAAADAGTSLLVRVTKSGLEPVTRDTLPVVRRFTDDLLDEDQRARQLAPAAPVELGGIAGYRYRYTYDASEDEDGAHLHYFLFRDDGRLIQLVFQAVPAARLDVLEAQFERIAGTFAST